MRELRRIRPPDDDAFDGADFLPAPEIEERAEMLRERHNLPVEITFAFLWKRKGGKKGGAPTRGWCQKLSGPAKYFADKDFLIWLGADTARDAKWSQDQYTALIYHELLFADVDYDDDGNATPTMRRVDIEGFLEEVRAYGLWEDNLANFAATAEQAPLWPFGGEAAQAAD